MKVFLLLLIAGAIQASDIIDGEFLIGLKPEYDSGVFASMLKSAYGLQMKNVWDIKRTKIMFVTGDDVDTAAIAALSEVKYISPNHVVREDQITCESTPHAGTWGLDRTDQRETLSYTSPSDPSAVYEHGSNTGLGVNAYVVDGGIDVTHPTYQGRAIQGYRAFDIPPDTGDYGTGHGTHTSGTIGSFDWGLAKEVSLIAVKVTNSQGSGSTAGFIDGLSWVQTQHVPGVDRSLVSASLGYGGQDQGIADIIGQMFIDGISFSVSAGNDDNDACSKSPAFVPECITVAATDVGDITASFTNYGTCVDIHAPGVDVLSAFPNDSTDIKSGTSMSAPHVAGVMARYMSSVVGDPPLPSEVTDWILEQATAGVLGWDDPSHEASPNLLLYASCSMASPK